MDRYDAYYNGTRTVSANPNTQQAVTKLSTNVRNIIYELIESQIDSTIPMPKVHAIHEEDEGLAKKIEAILLQQIERQRLNEMNDLQERTVPIQGGTYWHVEWDPKAGYHCNIGDLVVSDRHPKQVIPQPGVYDMKDMEYIFVLLSQPKRFVEEKYGIKIESDTESDPDVRDTAENSENIEGLVTQNLVYYRNKKGIGLFSWVDDQVVEDLEDYQARRLERCVKCGAVKDGDVCECGSKKFETKEEASEELTMDIQTGVGVIPAYSQTGEELLYNPDGTPQLDMNGNYIVMPILEKTKIPYYKPDEFPVILRRNIRKFGSFLGGSDVDVIIDQQDAISKLGTSIMEKLISGGSIVTLPERLNVETNEQNMKVVRIRNPAEKQLISAFTLQPDTSRDMNALEMNYAWAKSTLGITDSFQGKYDASAVSGTAKQFAAGQSAGRLESKRQMKRVAYSRLYELMFKFLLAYADEPFPITQNELDGTTTYSHFNKYEFLKQDAAGEWYWNDEFIFDVDTSLNQYSSREVLWSQIAQNYQAGAFGPIGDLDTSLALWTLYSKNGYPGADTMKQIIQERISKYAMSQMQIGDASGGQVLSGPTQALPL